MITTRENIKKNCAMVFQLPREQATLAENPGSADEAERKCHGEEAETGDQNE